MKITSALVGAVLAFSPTLAAAGVINIDFVSSSLVDVDFTDSHGDIGALVLQTSGSVQPGGTSLSSISGTFDTLPVSMTTFAGSDNKIYSSGPLVDYRGIAFVTSSGDFNLYWTNPTRGAAPGVYGLCYVANCNSSTGFYAIAGVPEPATWAMMLLGFAGLGFAGYRRMRYRTAALRAA